MNIHISFNCDNAAFDENFDAALDYILRQAQVKIYQQRDRRTRGVVCTHPESVDKLLDFNGNTIGTVKVSPDESK